MIIGGHFISL